MRLRTEEGAQLCVLIPFIFANVSFFLCGESDGKSSCKKAKRAPMELGMQRAGVTASHLADFRHVLFLFCWRFWIPGFIDTTIDHLSQTFSFCIYITLQNLLLIEHLSLTNSRFVFSNDPGLGGTFHISLPRHGMIIRS